MNQIRTVSCVAFISLALGGCAPLQQAPLVYSSKVSVGVDISATSTETPGVGLNVGYKQVDAAYVPVAVARKCESQDSKDCISKAYEIISLNGDSDQQDSVAPTDVAIARARSEADEASKLVAERSAAVDAANKKYDDDKNLSVDLISRRNDYTESSNGKGPSDPQTIEAKKKFDAAQEAANRLNNDKNAIAEAISLRDAAIVAAAKAYKDFQDLTERKSANRNGKRDAYSVFGTFDGNANATGNDKSQVGASLKIGKVFSTGIASQNLTEGMKANYAATGLVSCLQSAENLTSKMPDTNLAAKQKAISDLIQLCDKYASTAKNKS